ncbi:MAG: hypothetical protein C5B59_14595 [Bacteroidetes bacterium]|nr:MAG: hypothetical protein C5B59_14595 [Bacteroidota bacterium]
MNKQMKIWKCFPLMVAALGYTLSTRAQSPFARDIQAKFEDFSVRNLQEKIFVHADRSFYVAGEIIWFKVYCVDGYSNRPLNLSKIAYVEVLSADQKPLLQAKIALKDGSGSGSFLIPYTANSGNYSIRGYTSWMKNFQPEFYFEKNISIVNPGKRPDWVQEREPDYDIQFFPEGGSMVYGILSTVGFRVADRAGKGQDCSGFIINEKNDTVVRFNSLRFGLGKFNFKPNPGENYSAVVETSDKKLTKILLTNIYPSGYVMSVKKKDNDQLSVEVSTNIPGEPDQVFLFAQTRHVIKLIRAARLENGRTEFQVDEHLLGEGISQLTIFDKEGHPVCERLYFIRPQDSLAIAVKSGKEQYNRREQVNLDISSQNTTLNPASASLSMAVVLLDSLTMDDAADIQTYLWLSSDLKGSIESPNYYLRNRGTEVDEAIDNLMLTHGWRRFRWADILQEKRTGKEFLPEYDGHIVSGRVVEKSSGLSADRITTFLTAPGNRFQLNVSTSNSKGQIRFDLKNFFGGAELVAQTHTNKDSIYRVELSSPFSEKFSSNKLPPFNFSQDWSGQLVFRSRNAQVQQNFAASKKEHFIQPYLKDSTAFYGPPDKKYNLDDYTRFVTMEEVMREYVFDVRVRKQNDQFRFDVLNTPYKAYFENNPLVLLDGVPVFDLNKVMSFDPLKVRKIEVVSRKFLLDSTMNEGIVSFTTYDGNLSGFQLDPNALIVEYPGLQLQREFFSPVYDNITSSESRIPDFRTVLYWTPDLHVSSGKNQQVSFYTSDIPGNYLVVVQGLTQSGLAGIGKYKFSVSK